MIKANGWRFPLFLLLLLFTAVPAQEERHGESAAEVFEQTLSDQGLDAAVTRLRDMAADTSGAFEINGRELIFLARRMAQEWRYDESIALTSVLEKIYPESPWPKFDLGCLYLLTGDKDQAESYLGAVASSNPEFPLAAWILENLDRQLEIARIQIENQATFAPGENTGRQGPYLGETPPGSNPKIFANGLLCSTSNEYSITFSPDGKEIYFSRATRGTMMCRWEEGGWTAPESVELFGDSLECEEANVAPDGETIFFNARPSVRDGRQICRAKRIGGGWGEPERLFPGMYATSTLGGTVYYTMIGNRSDIGVIGKVVPRDGGYSDPDTVGGGVNSPSPDAHPYIAPDESYLIFDSSRDGKHGLYVCFRDANGDWGDAIYLHDHCDIPPLVGQPTVTPDGKYLFYSLHDDMYWVSAEIIERLRPRAPAGRPEPSTR